MPLCLSLLLLGRPYVYIVSFDDIPVKSCRLFALFFTLFFFFLCLGNFSWPVLCSLILSFAWLSLLLKFSMDFFQCSHMFFSSRICVGFVFMVSISLLNFSFSSCFVSCVLSCLCSFVAHCVLLLSCLCSFVAHWGSLRLLFWIFVRQFPCLNFFKVGYRWFILYLWWYHVSLIICGIALVSPYLYRLALAGKAFHQSTCPEILSRLVVSVCGVLGWASQGPRSAGKWPCAWVYGDWHGNRWVLSLNVGTGLVLGWDYGAWSLGLPG